MFHRSKAILPLLLAAFAASAAFGQDSATISIAVTDPSSAVVPAAQVTITETAKGIVRTKPTQPDGFATFDSLEAGEYSLEVSKAGFATYKVEHLSINARDRLSLRTQLQVAAAAAAAVDVVGRPDPLSTDPAQKVSIEQDFIRNLPVNGRNIESLILLTPGITSAADGTINTNGLRSNTNYYTVDGVSANRQIAIVPPAGGRGGGFAGPPGVNASGELISIDALQELRVQTSAFAPEFGRSPGAQISITSRGGSNTYHGSLFYYLRNDRFDANDWFANSGGYGRGKERQNRPGATFGGPVIRNRTFFFVSYEKDLLTAPYSVIVNVPDLLVRRSVPAPLRPFLNAFPLPNGPSLSSGTAQFRGVISNPYNTQSASLRFDHILTRKITLFVRGSYNPSNTDQRGSDIQSPNLLTHRDTKSQTYTLGMTRTSNGGAVNDLRLNYSDFTSTSNTLMDNFGGAVALTDAQVFPKGVTSANGSFNLNVIGLAGYSVGGYTNNGQKQVNVVDSLVKSAGNHNLKVGMDYRRTLVTTNRKPYSDSVSFNGVSTDTGIFSGNALNGQVAANLPAVYPTYSNFSLYAQDTWRLFEGFTLTYGARWDVNPAPGSRKGPEPFSLASSNIAGVTQNDPIYDTRWLNIAPRVGAAYQLDSTQGKELVLRGGYGYFYDTGYGTTGAAFSGAPFSSVRTLTSVHFPLSTANLTAPALPPSRPFGFVTTAQTGLVSPKVTEWNFTIERNLGYRRTLSVSYVGTSGTNLLRIENQPSFSKAYDVLSVTTNGATSTYHGLQSQYRQRIGTSLQVQVGYTYSHSIDSASNDAGFGGFATLFGGRGENGSSDFDIRHSINVAGSYSLPAPKTGLLFAPIRDWFLDFNGYYRTGLPFGVQGISAATSGANSSTTNPAGLFAQVRPNLTGKPIYIDDPKAPGGRRLNPAAFSIPTTYTQGNLGRNALRGFSADQIDLSLRRSITVFERYKINIAAQGFNILNHPNFANPSLQEGANLSSPNFGVATRMLNQSFGGGGATSIYRSGGARSMELSLRLQF